MAVEVFIAGQNNVKQLDQSKCFYTYPEKLPALRAHLMYFHLPTKKSPAYTLTEELWFDPKQIEPSEDDWSARGLGFKSEL